MASIESNEASPMESRRGQSGEKFGQTAGVGPVRIVFAL
jgi:hypothetical protein